MSRRHRRSRWIAGLLVFPILLIAYVSTSTWLPFFGNYLIQAEPPRPAEAAVVLAGDGWGLRVLRGGELVRDGFVPKALVSGPPGLYGFYESDLAVKFAVQKGLPEQAFEALHVDYRSTQEEAHAIVEELKRRNLRRVMIVTSDYHTRRAGRIWRYIAPWLELQMVAAPDRYFRPGSWWRDREASKRVFSEWTKMAAFTFDFFPPPQSEPVPAPRP